MVVRLILLVQGKIVFQYENYTELIVISGPKLGAGQSLVFSALLRSPDQCINCYIMCDGIGRYCLLSASANPDLL